LLSESLEDNLNNNQSTFTSDSNFNLNDFDFSISKSPTQNIDTTNINTTTENDLDDLSNFDLDQYFAKSSTQAQPHTILSNTNINNDNDLINDTTNYINDDDDFNLLNNFEFFDNILSVPSLPFSPYPLSDNMFPSFDNPLTSTDCAKEIDEFNDFLLSMMSDDYSLNNCINSSLSTSPDNNIYQNNNLNKHPNESLESCNKVQFNQTNNFINNQSSPKDSKSFKSSFDELRDLIPVISTTNPQISNQNKPNYSQNLANSFIPTTNELHKLDTKKMYRQKAIARYRKKKLNRMNSTNQIQNRMYVRRQAVAFRRPRNNGRFMGLQTHFISANQFTSSSI